MKTKPTEPKFKTSLRLGPHLLGKAVCLGAFILICSSAFAQNLFVSDFASENIYEFTSDGVQSTFASGLSGAMVFDKSGNLFVADFGGNIYKFTPGGVRSTIASGLDRGPTHGLACDSAGNLFVTTGAYDPDWGPINGSGKIYKLTPHGSQATFASGLDLPTDLAFDSAGNLFVANVKNNLKGVIYKFTPAGRRTTFVSELTNPEDVAFDSAGNLFVSTSDDPPSHTGVIYKITSGGFGSTFVVGFSRYAPLACDSADNLFVSDFGGNNIYKFTPGGVRSTIASGLSGSLAFQPIQAAPTPTPTPPFGTPTPPPTPTPSATPTPTPSPTSVTGNGTINTPSGHGSFSISASKAKRKWKGTFSYSDQTTGVSLTGKKLKNFALAGSQVHFTASAKIAKKKVTFTIDATDNGEPGTLDTFSISASNGYSASGNLITGDIMIH